MPTNKYDTNEHERPAMVWIVQCVLIVIYIALLIGNWHNYQYCSSTDAIQNCWRQVFFYPLLASLFFLGVLSGLFYGLEKGLSYARWITGILIIAWAVTGIRDMNYIQLIFRAMESGKGLHTPPYECWHPENAWNNVVIFCGYNSYAQLARKVLWEIVVLALRLLPGLWFIVDRSSKRYFVSTR